METNDYVILTSMVYVVSSVIFFAFAPWKGIMDSVLGSRDKKDFIKSLHYGLYFVIAFLVFILIEQRI